MEVTEGRHEGRCDRLGGQRGRPRQAHASHAAPVPRAGAGMRAIVGPMPCKGCGTLVVWGWAWMTLGDRIGSLMRHAAMYEVAPERVHLCAARVVSERVA